MMSRSTLPPMGASLSARPPAARLLGCRYTLALIQSHHAQQHLHLRGSNHGFAAQFLRSMQQGPGGSGVLSKPDLQLPPGGPARRSAKPSLLGWRHSADLPELLDVTRLAVVLLKFLPTRKPPPSPRSRRLLALTIPMIGPATASPKLDDDRPAPTQGRSSLYPNWCGEHGRYGHPPATGDLVVFSFPPTSYDAATPGTLVALSHFFGQHGYVPDVQNLDANINMRATFLARWTSAPNTVASISYH